MKKIRRSNWKLLEGMRGFMLVWVGQLITLFGSGMTRFAITIWAWQTTGSATVLALAGFFSFGPVILASPLAGALVDRSNRKLMMLAADLLSGLAIGLLLVLYLSGHLHIWHIYLVMTLAGLASSVQFPAFSAAITLMLNKQQYARADGMLSTAGSLANVFAPILAGGLIGFAGIGTILGIDVLTFAVAVATILLVHVPQPHPEAGANTTANLWQQSIFGFRYIFQRSSLLGLQLVFFAINFISMLAMVLLPPLVLARTGNNAAALGLVEAANGAGGVAGGILMSSWGGPRRKVHGVLLGMTLSSLLGSLSMGLGREWWMWMASGFFIAFFIPVINGSNQAIWQAKVAPAVQGRVFAARRMIAQVTGPVAMLLAGPLVDDWLSPAMRPGGSLVPWLGPLVGTGPGSGIALVFFFTGLLGALAALTGYLVPVIRRAEQILPDHDHLAAPVSPGK